MSECKHNWMSCNDTAMMRCINCGTVVNGQTWANHLQSQLAAKERQLERAARDCLDGFECIYSDHFQDCKGPSKDCVDYWRRRWEEQAK